MITLVHEPQPDNSTESAKPPAEDVQAGVGRLLDALYPRGVLVERRGERRYPFPYLVRLTPVAEDGITARGEAVVVVGKHLSSRGLGFYHPGPLPHRRMIASLEVGDGRRLDFLINLSWCRFTKQGWYESGGRLLQVLSSSHGRARVKAG